MNKTDRMLAIILELQSHGRLRAEDLAATFETSVRTIYRDMQALSEAGVPVIGSPGQGYSLVEGYFLPPISLTSEEAVTLLLGLEFIDQQFDEDYQARAADARRKIEAVLHAKVKDEAERIRAGMRLQTSKRHTHELEALNMLRQAISESKQVRFHYTTRSRAYERTARTINPYGLVFRNGSWMLVGYCHLRQEMRHFLLRRMSQLELLEERFDMPADYVLDHDLSPDNRNVMVRIRVQPLAALKIKEYDVHYVESIEESPEETIVTLRVRHEEDILSWILGLGSEVEVLEPESLRLRIKIEIINMLNRY